MACAGDVRTGNCAQFLGIDVLLRHQSSCRAREEKMLGNPPDTDKPQQQQCQKQEEDGHTIRTKLVLKTLSCLIISNTKILPLSLSLLRYTITTIKYSTTASKGISRTLIILRRRPLKIPREGPENNRRYATLYPSLQHRPALNFPSFLDITRPERKKRRRPATFY